MYVKDELFNFSVNHIVESIKEDFNYLRLHTLNSGIDVIPLMKMGENEFRRLSVENGDILIPEDMINNKIDVFTFSKYTTSLSSTSVVNIDIKDYLKGDNTLGTLKFSMPKVIVRY